MCARRPAAVQLKAPSISPGGHIAGLRHPWQQARVEHPDLISAPCHHPASFAAPGSYQPVKGWALARGRADMAQGRRRNAPFFKLKAI